MSSENNSYENVTFPPTLQQTIEDIVKKEGFLTYKIYARILPTDGGSYLGELYEVDIKGKTAEGEKETNIFVKKMHPGAAENLSDHFSLSEAFSTETFVYTELTKIFTELQGEANVPQDDRYKMIKGYEPCTEAILLENVAKRGFRTGYRMDLVTLKFAELSIEQLAKFHALSLVLENRRPIFFYKHINSRTMPVTSVEVWRSVIQNHMIKTATSIEDCEVRQKALEFIEIAMDKFVKYLDSDQTPIRCLCHGDYRANNILKKEINGEATEVIPVDYQLLHFGCPINDFIFFIFLGTDREFRNQHLENLKDLYHNTLTKFLQYFNLNVDDIFPRKIFEDVYKERLDYGLVVALFISGYIFAEDSDVLDISDAASRERKPKLDFRFQKWFKDILEDCICT